MEWKVMEKAIPLTEVLFDDFEECPVDCDFVLPDYLADVAAILKCTLTPSVQSRQISGDRVLVDGTATMHVLYLDEGRKCTRSCEYSRPFNCHFSVGNIPAGAVLQVDAHTNYMNCRAIGPRKLSMHGAFTVKCRVIGETACRVVGDVAEEGCYTRCRRLSFAVPAGSAEKVFTVNEMTDIGAGKPAVQSISRVCALPIITDCKLIQGKAIVKGELALHTLYVADAETGDLQTVEHHLPFSQLIDVDGLTEEWVCETQVQAVSCEVHATANTSGENRLLDINVKLSLQLFCTRCGEEEVVEDAYAVRYPLTLEHRDLSCERLCAVRQGVSTVRQVMEMPSDGEEAVDAWCELIACADRCENGLASVDGKLNICLLARDAQGALAYYERPLDFSLDFDEGCTDMCTRMQVCRLAYTQTGNQLEVRVDLTVSRRCFDRQNCRAVTAIAADESEAFPTDAAALKIYYAGVGESLWDIAKRYHTAVDAVMEENSLTADELTEDKMLLIPMC